MQMVFQQIRDIAQVDWTALIDGETGTGKELVARAIHDASHRRDRPFVAVNCAGLTDSLLSSQLFGHRRGAFTGAVNDQVGLFEAADGGTIFLDEIGDISKNVQTSLLRVLEEREITRLGESTVRRIDVRVIAATNRDLAEEVARGAFRADLLYRIRVARVRLPRLADRREDIPLLVASFL
ncbi:sigma-54 factor interaction domain-containing protein, partial [bacterium]|nr:sigma-54 factor interaction domain-containing protein [bacterium]